MAKDRGIFVDPVHIDTREAYDWYRQKRKWKSKTVDQYNYFVKALHGILVTARNMVSESEGGLYIDRFGYFFFLRSPEKYTRKNPNEKSLLKRYTKKYWYKLTFDPDREFTGWTFDKCFVAPTLYGKKDHPYKVHFDICEAHRISKEYERTRFKEENFRQKKRT